MEAGFKCYIKYEDFSNEVCLYIAKNINPDFRQFLTLENEKLMVNQVKLGDGIKPLLKLNGYLADELLQAMANALDKHGIRPEGKPVLENELTATKYHLEDMRKIVFDALPMQNIEVRCAPGKIEKL